MTVPPYSSDLLLYALYDRNQMDTPRILDPNDDAPTTVEDLHVVGPASVEILRVENPTPGPWRRRTVVRCSSASWHGPELDGNCQFFLKSRCRLVEKSLSGSALLAPAANLCVPRLTHFTNSRSALVFLKMDSPGRSRSTIARPNTLGNSRHPRPASIR